MGAVRRGRDFFRAGDLGHAGGAVRVADPEMLGLCDRLPGPRIVEGRTVVETRPEKKHRPAEPSAGGRLPGEVIEHPRAAVALKRAAPHAEPRVARPDRGLADRRIVDEPLDPRKSAGLRRRRKRDRRDEVRRMAEPLPRLEEAGECEIVADVAGAVEMHAEENPRTPT